MQIFSFLAMLPSCGLPRALLFLGGDVNVFSVLSFSTGSSDPLSVWLCGTKEAVVALASSTSDDAFFRRDELGKDFLFRVPFKTRALLCAGLCGLDTLDSFETCLMRPFFDGEGDFTAKKSDLNQRSNLAKEQLDRNIHYFCSTPTGKAN